MVTKNRTLRTQIKGRVRLTDAERTTLAAIGKKLGKTALARMHDRIRPSTVLEVPPMVEYATVVFGYQYPSSAVLGALDDGGPAFNPAQLAGQPGTPRWRHRRWLRRR